MTDFSNDPGGTAGSSSTQTHDSDAHAGIDMGPYRLLHRLGEGGMGEVWLAQQRTPVRRRVALKIIKAGFDTGAVIARFQAERQALALMNHPGIAKVFDAGSTLRGRPYFAMEYVQGESLTTYCDRQRLSLPERLELFIQVCEGVQHAHQKGIIHRDLKPSNILVAAQDDRPVAKIIDFGISKATGQEITDRTQYTMLGGFIGTLEYMSPEQAQTGGVDVDTRSDVYALGVVLYELLTGMLPLDRELFTRGGIEDIRRTIGETDPPRPSRRITQVKPLGEAAAASRRMEPSRLAAALRGDLDWIVLKALEKDRTKRYQTANGLALDIRRHMTDEPVSAGPPGTSYRMHKFIRRHRLGVSIASAILLLLIGFAVVTTVQATRIRRERDRANREAQTAEQVISFLVGLFNISDPEKTRGDTVTARQILDTGAATIEQTLTTQPQVQARLQATMGRVYMNLGFYRQAEDLLQRALLKYRATAGEDDRETMATLSALADALWFAGRFSQAEAIYRDLTARRTRLLGADHVDTLKARYELASVYAVQERFHEAEVMSRDVLEAQRRVLGHEHPDTLATLNNLGAVLHLQKRYDEELRVTGELLAIRLRVYGPDHPDTLRSYNNMGMLYSDLQRWRDAEQALETAANGKRRVLGEAHPATVLSVVNLATVYRHQTRYADAERELRRAAMLVGVEEAGPPVQWIRAEGRRLNLAIEFDSLYRAWGKLQKASAWRARIPNP